MLKKKDISSSNGAVTLCRILEHRDVTVPLDVAHKILAMEIQVTLYILLFICRNSYMLKDKIFVIFWRCRVETQVVQRGAIRQDNYSKNLTYALWACQRISVIISPVGWNFNNCNPDVSTREEQIS